MLCPQLASPFAGTLTTLFSRAAFPLIVFSLIAAGSPDPQDLLRLNIAVNAPSPPWSSTRTVTYQMVFRRGMAGWSRFGDWSPTLRQPDFAALAAAARQC